MSEVAYPKKHISVRVPWHDLAWNGTICSRPKHNTSCCKLLNIAQSKDESSEELLAGHSLKELDQTSFPPCVKERGTFMADFGIERFHEHPYAKNNSESHEHFRPTPLKYPAYSVAALPFRWMMKPVVFGDTKQGETGLVKDFPLDGVNLEHEPKLKFDSYWIQDVRNHQALLECFWNHVRVEESLVFFYAKQVPLVEDTGRRVLIGAGRVLKIGGLTEYAYNGSPEGKLRSLIWERMISHSIRPSFTDGFLLPYHEALAKCDGGNAFDPADVVAFAPEDRFNEFSYATEHVSDDAAISSLLSCRAALQRAGKHFSFSSTAQEKWIDQQLGILWKKRGAFPGIGAVLGANGVHLANFIGQALHDKVGDDGNPWQAWNAVIENPTAELPPELAVGIDATICKAWRGMSSSRRQFLELLSRIDVSQAQADMLALPEERAEANIPLSDDDFLKNPYLFYETTRFSTNPLGVRSVDRGVFSTSYIRTHHSVPEPSSVKTGVDGRRLRALVIRELEGAAMSGDTLRARAEVITSLRRGDEDAREDALAVNADLLSVAEKENFPNELRCVAMADGARAYQLERLARVGEKINQTIKKRLEGKRHTLAIDWRAELDKPESKLGPLPESGEEQEKEERARQEKAAALEEIFSARVSVLIGPAGTGKTTLLSVLCRRPEIQEGGIVLLAPTGKARVRMEDVARQAGVTHFKAQTLAQFLAPSKRYDGATQRYQLTGIKGEPSGRTVIVDECSMLTEEMMAALIEALSGVHRLIFVGDPRQLPPIGAGRPFADIVVELKPQNIETKFPRVGKSYAELTVPRRQGAGEREDIQLAAWFAGSALSPGEDRVFEILAGQRKSQTIEFVRWETPDELESILPDVLAQTLKFDPEVEEWQAFACSLGGQVSGDHVYFNRARSGKECEAWQLLSPVRQQPWGVEAINRQLHERYKAKQLEVAKRNVPPWKRRLPRPFGDAQIVYGDKVINLRNQKVRKKRLYPSPGADGYLANGEIGSVIGQIRTRNFNYEPKTLQVEFSTQQGSSFEFYEPKGDDSEFSLDLAYALTVHKAQGSEFGVVFLVLPRSTLMLTRELIYTALTRQKSKVVILHQGSATDLQKLSSEIYSATATRLTNLFSPPSRVEIAGKFLEEKLIHRTAQGEAVRSKSEVIIANLLHGAGVNYHYECPLELGGVVKYPDFTIEDDDSGITYYWEHCGLLHDASYNARWEEKKEWYRVNGILPIDEGGGPKGVLITTRDTPSGAIDSADIADLIASLLN